MAKETHFVSYLKTVFCGCSCQRWEVSLRLQGWD